MYALSHDLCLGPEFDLLVYFETTKCVANTVSTCVFLNHVIPNEAKSNRAFFILVFIC